MPRGAPGVPRYRRPIAERFWEKVSKTETCWLWTGHRYLDGRGVLMAEDQRTSDAAHRVSWRLHFGAIPVEAQIGQTCRNPGCVRPDHLRLLQRASTTDLFWRHVTKTETCWLWTGARRGFGYGMMGVHGLSPQPAHRVSWRIHYGEIPGKLFVCHKCDVPACVRPDHLFLGTASDNMQDAARKGRIGGGPGKGEAHFKARLATADVLTIRASVESDTVLAQRYAVRRGQIWNIRNGKTWRHLA